MEIVVGVPLRRFSVLSILFLSLVLHAIAASTPQAAAPSRFAPLEAWRLAVLSGDSAKLRDLYSRIPVPQISDLNKNPLTLQNELLFWSGWKAKGLTDLKLEMIQEQEPQPNTHLDVFRASLTLQQGAAVRHEYLVVVLGWAEQERKWLIGFAQRSDAAQLRQPIEKKDIYPAGADPQKEIAQAVSKAAQTHHRVLLVFGGNWCYDCHVLEDAFHSPEIAPTLAKSFEVVHIDIGQMDKNLDVANKYDIPVDRGVPAVAVLDSDGKLLFSQKRREFEAARSMSAEDILEFLNKWTPTTVSR